MASEMAEALVSKMFSSMRKVAAQMALHVLWNSHLTTIFHFVLVCYCLALWTIL